MVGRNVGRIDGRHLYSAARSSRRNCLIAIVTPVVYPRFLEFLYVDIQSTAWANIVTTLVTTAE